MTTRRDALEAFCNGVSALLVSEMCGRGGASVSSTGSVPASSRAHRTADLGPTPIDQDLPRFKDAAGPEGLVAGAWSNPYVPSAWAEEDLMGDYVWRPANAVFDATGALNLCLSERPKGVGQVQAGSRSYASDGIWEADVVIGQCLPGLIQAPLWLYENKTLEEVNIEIVGVKGMTAAVAANVGGKRWVWDSRGYLLEGDLSGWAGRLAIRYRAGQFIRFYINGAQVAEATPANSTLNGGGFPTASLKSYHQLWPAIYPGGPAWAGRFIIPTGRSVLKVKTIGVRREPGISAALNDSPS